jgi:hypothetical protein
MFRKIVSNLAFSPALVGQLSFYAKRLRKEETTRRLGLIFTALALVVQSLAVFNPPEAANASSTADFVRGGVSSLSDFVNHYEKNTNDIKNIFSSLGITKAEIKAAQSQTIGERGYYNWSMTSLYSASQGQKPYKYDGKTIYSRPMTLTQEGGDKHTVYVGQSAKFGWFAIKKDCGNLITKKQVTSPTTYAEGGLVPTPPAPTPPPAAPLPPRAICTKLEAIINNRTNVNQVGYASVERATISSYQFTIKNSAGTTVSNQTVASTGASAQPEAVVIDTPGNYTATLQVTTSIGVVSDAQNCVKAFTIAPPEVCQYNPSLPVNSPKCQPCPDNPELWIEDQKCSAELVSTKSALNLSQGNIDATTKVAKSADKIAYTITIKNSGLVSDKAAFTEDLSDVLEYATLIDNGSGVFDKEKGTLTWPEITLASNEQQSRTFVVQLMNPIPVTNTGTSNEASYDCRMVNTFGNAVEINVDCAPEKVIVEQTVAELPKTGPTENMLFGGSLFAVVTYFYTRSRQLGKEVKLIRRNVTTGAF